MNDTDNTYYIIMADTPESRTRRTYARAESIDRVKELVYNKFREAVIWKIGRVTDTEIIEIDRDQTHAIANNAIITTAE